jgi:protein required for attachment to host cells
MKTNWLVVANAARARLLEETGRPGVYRERADLVHPQSRQRGSALRADRAGHVLGAKGAPGGAAYEPRTDAREREHERFAQQVAQMLDAGVARGECAGIVLVASSPFLGRLEAHLGQQSRKAVVRTVARDYTALRDTELAQRLHESPPSTP